MTDLDLEDLVGCVDDDPGYIWLFRMFFWWLI